MTKRLTSSPQWQQNNVFGTLDAAVAHLDEWGACGVMIQREDLEVWLNERRVLHDALLTLVSHIHMRAHPSNRAKWICPYCKGTHSSLTALEEGEGHMENFPYAAAQQVLKGNSCS